MNILKRISYGESLYILIRYVDNFSAGTRGAASTEYFIKQGYAVIFLNREGSIQPFFRHTEPQKLFEKMSLNDKGTLEITDDRVGIQL